MKFEIVQIDPQELERFENIKREFDITAIEVEDSDQFVNLANLLKKVKGRIKEVQEFFKEPKSKAWDNHKSIVAKEKEYTEYLNKFETLAKKAISEFKGENEIVPKVKGISTMTKKRWRVIDLKQVPEKIGNIELWTLDTKAIDDLVANTNLPIPGIEVYEERIVSVRGGIND